MKKILLLLFILFMLPLKAPEVGYLNVAVADLNGDGFSDIVAAHWSKGISVWLNDGKGNFTPRACLSTGQFKDVAVDDVNEDGFNDIVGGGGDLLILFLGDGKGNFKKKKSVSRDIEGLAIADMNGDGRKEIIGGGRYGLFIFDASLSALQTVSKEYVRQIAVADMDGDSQNEIVATIYRGGISIFHAEGDTFTERVIGLAPFYDIIINDIDGDGKPDILASGARNGFVVCLSKEDFKVTDLMAYKYFGLALADMNGDGWDDVVGASDGLGIHIWLGNGTGGFAAPQHYPTTNGNFWGMQAGDMNGDGKPDIVSGMEFGGVAVFFMKGTETIDSIILDIDCDALPKSTGIAGVTIFLFSFLFLKKFIRAQAELDHEK
jgi:hypothetical protein